MNDSEARKPEGNSEGAGGTENTQRCPPDKKGPFVHCFATPEGKYVYDANTMCIVPVDEIVWEIVPDVGVLAKEELVARYAGRFAADEIGAAYERVLAQQQEGYFLPRWPRVEFTLPEEQVREVLRTKREILILNVTERCNFRCQYCSYDGRHEGRPAHSSKEMAWSVAKQAIDEFLPCAIETPSITFYGGEPLLNLGLIKECVAYAHRALGNRQVRFGMTTNGALLTEDVADYLAAEDFSVTVSLDGPQQIHDRYRRTADDRPTWSLVAQNLRDPQGEVRTIPWDLARRLARQWQFQGERIWCQNTKPLGIWGYPKIFVPNYHHHYCLVFRKRENGRVSGLGSRV